MALGSGERAPEAADDNRGGTNFRDREPGGPVLGKEALWSKEGKGVYVGCVAAGCFFGFNGYVLCDILVDSRGEKGDVGSGVRQRTE